MQRLTLVSLFTLGLVNSVWADAQPVKVVGIQVHPREVKLRSDYATTQLIVTGTMPDGKLIDLTHQAAYTSRSTSVATVTASGRVTPVGNGRTELLISYQGQSVPVPIQAEHLGENLPLNFTNHVVPIFTKLGCNSGGCHGKASGQNGFRLSLLGFEPELDYRTLVKESRGRRLLPSAPDQSLFLLKAIGAMPHGGGRKMEANSDEYKIVRRWIASGMPFGEESDPVVTRISVYPEHRILNRESQQQFAAYAHYSDGTVEDITRRAQYESNDTEIAVVEGNALVRTLKLSGEAAIMARYQGQVAVFRVSVPLGLATPNWSFSKQTLVDEHTSKKWRDLGLVPSELASDEVIIRRLYLDLTGTLPTPEQIKAFLTDTSPKKRDKLIEELLDSPNYADYFAGKWADILRVKRHNDKGKAPGTFAFHSWIREAMAADIPYSEFVRSVLAANGTETLSPPTVWYKELSKPEEFVDDTAQVFLGLRMACANCHHHPYEKWSQDDYWGLAAFFGRLGRKQIQQPVVEQRVSTGEQLIFTLSSGSVTNKRTNKPAAIKPLDGDAIEPGPQDDPRQLLVDWMVDPKNPFFAKALVNRYWAHFLGRGIVDPIDDMRVTNPPSNPELLDALAKHFIESNFSLKSLIRLIVKSRTYQLSALPNEFNKNDKQAYARYYPKRLSAEVLLDAVNQVTASPTNFNGLPRDKNAPNRAIQLPDESFNSYFLDVFGRPSRNSACECERVSEANLAQALHMLNSDEVQQKIVRGGGRADLLSRNDQRPEAEKVEELFLWALGRKPTDQDLKAALAHIAKHQQSKKTAYENLIWALLNTKEFIFNQ